MNHTPAPQLDTFEAALLLELKSVVSEAATAVPEARPATPGRPQLRRGQRWHLPAAAAAVAALVIGLLVPAVRPTPAYAVSGRDNGGVTVRVNRLEGADGLERALGKHGIPADVTYLPYGKKCASGRYTAVDAHGLMLSTSAQRFEVTIPPNTVGSGDTFVLSAAVVPLAPGGVRAMVHFDIASGAIAPCRIVNAP